MAKITFFRDGDAGLRLDLAIALLKTSSFDRAEEHLRAAVRLNPDSAQAHYQMGLYWVAKKEPARGMEQFHLARRIDPSLRPPGTP